MKSILILLLVGLVAIDNEAGGLMIKLSLVIWESDVYDSVHDEVWRGGEWAPC